MILRSTLRLSIVSSVFFAVMIGLSHAQPYDDSALRSLLSSEPNCPMPCWQGVQLGVTPLDEAIQRLRANHWVGSVQKRAGYRHIWTWSDAKPAAVTGDLPQYLFSWRAEVAETISLQNLPPLWQLWLVLGQPDTIKVALMDTEHVMYIASYDRLQVHIFNLASCTKQSPVAVWHLQSRLDIGRLVYFPIARPVEFSGSQWFSVFNQHRFC